MLAVLAAAAVAAAHTLQERVTPATHACVHGVCVCYAALLLLLLLVVLLVVLCGIYTLHIATVHSTMPCM
jgi:hypothetical protein